jgi:hypothetical protein
MIRNNYKRIIELDVTIYGKKWLYHKHGLSNISKRIIELISRRMFWKQTKAATFFERYYIHRFDVIVFNIHSFSLSEQKENLKYIESFIETQNSFQFIWSIFQFSKT